MRSKKSHNFCEGLLRAAARRDFGG
jgi:hypothetical protein